MSLFNKINISLSGEPWLLFLGFVLILIYTIYLYKVTLPNISRIYKIVLIALRTIALSIILLLMFEPILSITQKKIVEPVNLIFIDNSKSISKFTATKDLSEIKKTAHQIFKKVKGINKIFTFGKGINEITEAQVDSLKFNETSTNLNSILKYKDKYENTSSIILISDGIINEGKNPLTEAKNLSVPIYTIVVGDTTNSNDISVTDIKSNEFIYPGHKTQIEVSINNVGFSDKKVSVKLFEKNKLLESKNTTLSSTGINRIIFPYSSELAGKHKLIVKVTTDKNEHNKINNKRTTIINILATKKKILLLSGSPSSDLSAIKSSLSKDENLEINSVIQINTNTFYKDKNYLNKINEADILIFINFPSTITDNKIITGIKETIENSDKPSFLCFSNNTDFAKLELLNDVLPFTFSNKTKLFFDTQVEPVNLTNNLLGNTEQLKNEWKNLPPINSPLITISPNISTEILLKSNTKNETPILFTNNINGRKSIILNAANIWKWKLQATHKEYKLFDNFILNSIKWLSLKNDKELFKLKPNKNIYKLGETIKFTASLYDETFNPVSTANIIVEITNNNQKQKFNFSSLGNGIYESKINLNKPGVYKYRGELLFNGKVIKQINGKFTIEQTELELIDSKANKNLLLSLSNLTLGNTYNLMNHEQLVNRLNSKYNSLKKYSYQDNKLHLSTFDFILLFIVLIFSIEWLIRKILRML